MALSALGWGLIAGSAVFLGALIAWFARPPARLVAAAMAFASGILLSVAAFELLDEAFAHGGFLPVAAGYTAGAVLFALGLHVLNRAGAGHRKHANPAIGPGTEAGGMVFLGTLLDGIPEALIIGLNFYAGEGLGIATVVAVFLSNVPESINSTTRMKGVGHRRRYVFGVWTAVALVSGLASLAGYLLLGDVRSEWVSVIRGIAGGAFLVFIVDTMIPEAFAEDRNAAGLIAALGFLVGFGLSHGFA